MDVAGQDHDQFRTMPGMKSLNSAFLGLIAMLVGQPREKAVEAFGRKTVCPSSRLRSN